MARRQYSSTARPTTLAAAITSTVTTLSVPSQPGTWPAPPFTIAVERGGTNEELMLVTARAGSGPLTLTVERGFNGTTAVAHAADSPVEHAVGAIDYDEANLHINGNDNRHGIGEGSSVVGTATEQTLSNKTLEAPAIGDFTNAPHDHSTPDQGGPAAGGASAGVNFALLLMGA